MGGYRKQEAQTVSRGFSGEGEGLEGLWGELRGARGTAATRDQRVCGGSCRVGGGTGAGETDRGAEPQASIPQTPTILNRSSAVVLV